MIAAAAAAAGGAAGAGGGDGVEVLHGFGCSTCVAPVDAFIWVVRLRTAGLIRATGLTRPTNQRYITLTSDCGRARLCGFMIRYCWVAR